jgi:hypothetical protein
MGERSAADQLVEGSICATGLVGVRDHLLELFESFVAEEILHGGIVVEAAHGRA